MNDPVYCQLLADLESDQMQISVISMGIKSGGKSTKALSFIRLCIQRGFFDHYYMVLPSYQTDIGGAYKWLSQFSDLVTVFSTYEPLFVEWLLNRDLQEIAKLKRGYLLLFDHLGATGFKATDESMFKLVGIQRHLKVSTYLHFHSLSS